MGPENSNQINVSVKKNPNFYVFLAKKYFETHETIELHALGNAVSTSVIASENLVRNNYATFGEIRTKTITVQSTQGNNRGDSKKAKLFITLNRSKDFFDVMKKFNEIREENERLNAKETEEKKASTEEQQ
uniref:DNA/RNA-binding protein Alba-like domain-containing protein n=1 Tax=Strombidinopsis acuminata TaxID=141414 RepID=A0A7S3TVL7_9SPIT|mmetsp:Transcript_78007/g.107848  ORF Transcript_78007/g.107848 Transcript_78007/m.107848 type:complete len:131 (+) Transcript_78007:152-544(+)|eukprot:CAMPEP_0176403752 /NCGR_PEP_ID=MMETSP0126-20121128/50353_1 /TAXON_ID=141414 ORGANISM="Strombidinopsis acuminatum, Strain SPMC142" /NCGR_SAMPLE_ID=MMETSP0126 /ASSEMBLY_ACC=CAM_ASM_000229 /LENGTH=130 /DNA_ID=CAMNT_0017782205 /DNA_START=139 /DNA_END=531 /DNA_ORIENTATION=+